MAIILNGVSYKPYHNGPISEVWVNGIKRWPSGWICNPQMGSIAVSHTVLEGGDTDQQIWLAVVDNGHGIVLSSPTTPTIDPVTYTEQHKWTRRWTVPADEITVAFAAAIHNTQETYKEYVTDAAPWIFWIKDGTLHGQKFGTETYTALAAENCTSVSASSGFKLLGSSFFDYGLCVFFIVGGKLYYRQCISDVWYDAVEVLAVPAGLELVRVAASRTWDYRLVVQMLTIDGTLYELYTQQAGLGKTGSEHISLLQMSSTATCVLTAIAYHEAQEGIEHIDLLHMSGRNTAPYGGCYLIGPAQICAAWNIPTIINDDEGVPYEDWGLRVCVKFDHEISENDVNMQIARFEMQDERNRIFYPGSATADVTGRIFTFTFTSFNNARGNLTFKYTAGTVSTMAGDVLLTSAALFTPENLAPTPMPGPKPIRLWNE